jgi:SpoVK/Ycf46/Vps4 family AAA+-type ATPase
MFQPFEQVTRNNFITQSHVKKALDRNLIFSLINNLYVHKGILFYGPSGNGKSICAENLVGYLQNATNRVWDFFSYNCTSFLKPFLGEGEDSLVAAFSKAVQNVNPCVLFFDEIDSLCCVRNSNSDQHYVTLVSTFLCLFNQNFEGKVLVVGATNRIESIDKAFRRFGRFGMEIFFGNPDDVDRKKFLIHFTGNQKHGVDFDLISEKCLGFSVAKLKQLAEEAIISCRLDGVSKLQNYHFLENISYDIPWKTFNDVVNKYKVDKSTLFVGKNSYVVGKCLYRSMSHKSNVIFLPRLSQLPRTGTEDILENAKLKNSLVIAYDYGMCLDLQHFFESVIILQEEESIQLPERKRAKRKSQHSKVLDSMETAKETKSKINLLKKLKT